MLKELSKLYALQQVDTEIGRLEQEQANLKRGEEMQKRVHSLKSSLGEMESRLRTLDAASQDKKHELQRLFEQYEEGEQRLDSDGELDITEVTNIRAYLDSVAEKQRRTSLEIQKIEAQRTRLKGEIEEKRTVLAETQAELEEVLAYEAEERARLEEELEEQRETRARLAQQIAPPALKRYERTRKHCANLAIVQVEEDVCPGCRMVLTPYLVRQLREGTGVQDCPNCRRILYWPGGDLEIVDKVTLITRRR